MIQVETYSEKLVRLCAERDKLNDTYPKSHAIYIRQNRLRERIKEIREIVRAKRGEYHASQHAKHDPTPEDIALVAARIRKGYGFTPEDYDAQFGSSDKVELAPINHEAIEPLVLSYIEGNHYQKGETA